VTAPPDEENWRPVRGYAGWYEVSDLGRVMSLPRPGTPGGLVSVYLNSKGYPVVTLSKYGRTRTVLVSRLVLSAFDGPPRDRRVKYGPGGVTDTRLANLEWRLLNYAGGVDTEAVRSAALIAAAGVAGAGTQPADLTAYADQLIPWITAQPTAALDVILVIPGTPTRLHSSNGGTMAFSAAVTDTSVVITATCKDAGGNPTGEQIRWTSDDPNGTILTPAVSADFGTWTGTITGTTGTVNVSANASQTAGVTPFLAQIVVGPGPTVRIDGDVTVNH
jgi:hypothetical protein